MAPDTRFPATDGDLRVTPFATHWGTYFAETRDGRLVGVRDYRQDPSPATIGPGIVDAVTSPSRVGRPMVRQGFLAAPGRADPKGRGREPFVAVPWDEALDLAARELRRVVDQHGNGAVFGGSYGWASAGRLHHAQSQIHRFLNMLGGYVRSVDNYSYAASNVISPYVVGRMKSELLDRHTTWPVIAEHGRLVVMFGGLPAKNAQVTSGGVGQHTLPAGLRAAKARGVRFVAVTPQRTDAMAELDADWLALRPNTDTALMLGLAHTLITEGLHDRSFLDRYCAGFERFAPYVLGEADGVPKTADWAAAITELPADRIRSLAREMAATRTLITTTWSLQRADHGEQPYWMSVALAALLGQVGLPGGGFGHGYSSENGIGNPVRLFKWPSVPQGQNPVEDFIPVARFADMMLNPGGPYLYNGQERTYPEIRAVYWAGGNPFHHHQDLAKLVRAFQTPELVIVNEIWWTGTARHADIVFPTTTVLERNDIAMTHWEPLVVAMHQAIAPVGQSRHDFQIFAGLADRLGFGDGFTENRDEGEWLRLLWNRAQQRAAEHGFTLPDFETLWAEGTCRLPDAEAEPVLLEDFRRDPDRHPLSTPTGKIELFSETIAGFGHGNCPPHPAWIPPAEWLGADAAKRFPLHLISNQPKTRLHGQLDPGTVSRASKIQGREPLRMHPDDAAARGIADGDVVRVYNDRGSCLAGVILTDGLRPGVVQLSTGAWYDPAEPGVPGSPCKHGNPNVLTRDVGTSTLGQGSAAQSCLVEIEPLEGPPPPVTAHDPPEIIEPLN